MIRTVVIDDENKARETIIEMLGYYCKDVEIVGEAKDVKSAAGIIKKTNPDLVLLDIKMPDGTGFDLLRMLDNIDFHIVFITAYEEFAIKAFRFSALDYLLKPIDPDDLVRAIDKVEKLIRKDELELKVSALLDNIGQISGKDKKLVLKTTSNIHVVNLEEIIRCQSDKNYTHFFTADGEKIIVSKTLKDFDELLKDYGFYRVHQSHLVNFSFIKRYEKSDGGFLVMKDNSKVPVSFRKKEELMKIFKSM